MSDSTAKAAAPADGVQRLKFYQKGTFTVGNRLVSEAERSVQSSSDRSNALTCGHRACQGCGEALGARYAIDAAMRASNGKLVAVNATGCLEVFTTPYPETSWQLPWMHSLFGNAAAVATGVAAAMRVTGRNETRVIAQGGDGGDQAPAGQAGDRLADGVRDEAHANWRQGAQGMIHRVEMEALQVRQIAGEMDRQNLPSPANHHFVPAREAVEDQAAIRADVAIMDDVVVFRDCSDANRKLFYRCNFVLAKGRDRSELADHRHEVADMGIVHP